MPLTRLPGETFNLFSLPFAICVEGSVEGNPDTWTFFDSCINIGLIHTTFLVIFFFFFLLFLILFLRCMYLLSSLAH